MKDSQYWKDYNQKRKEYLAQKKRESRAKLKGLVVDTILSVVDMPKVVDLNPVVDSKLNNQVVDTMTTTKEVVVDKVVDQAPMSTTESIQSQEVVDQKPPLWSSHYSVLKPYCSACFQAGIKETEYAFCSLKRIQDALTIRLPNRYVCNVYHWTLFQGQGRIKGGKM